MGKFQAGDYVHVYGSGPDGGAWGGVVIQVEEKVPWGYATRVKSTYNRQEYLVHPKQCRKLIRKERRRVWVRYKEDGYWKDFLTVKPLDLAGWVEFVEVKKKCD